MPQKRKRGKKRTSKRKEKKRRQTFSRKQKAFAPAKEKREKKKSTRKKKGRGKSLPPTQPRKGCCSREGGPQKTGSRNPFWGGKKKGRTLPPKKKGKIERRQKRGGDGPFIHV